LAVFEAVRVVKVLLLAGGALGLLALVYLLDGDSVGAVLATITGWQFLLVCCVYGISVVADTLGWRFTLTGERPPFHRLLAARCAGEAVNVLTALGSVGGEAVKAWLLRREISYEASVPSLVLAKTTLIVAQTLLLVAGLLIAFFTGIAGPTLLTAMAALLVVQVLCTGGFVLVQNAGLAGRASWVLSWLGVRGQHQARRFDEALRHFYRREWRSLLCSVGAHLAGCLLGALEGFVILAALGLPASLTAATVLESLGTGVRFATFFIPASLGSLEGANAAAFTAFGWAASAGLAFTLVRRGRQAVWIVLGIAILLAMGVTRAQEGAPAGTGSPHATRS
ncbi:MAG TPA: lysylphosphatidylglycerol synthase transmembrane domain-containing protein, partial [Solirubrobacterales bacterium]|nr:lysylphosphatidylglycerol synthase transmembrane domain-containing protein [Solirubrobacterales bacterium]